MPSLRVPAHSAPNLLARLLAERRAAGARLLDLTESNPTRAGLVAAEAGQLAALADARAASYDPAPLGAPEARAAVARYYADRGLGVDPARVALTASTSEAVAHLLRLLADPGETVLAPSPSYPLFEPLAAAEGVRLAHYRLAYDGAWHLDHDSLERAVGGGARAVIVVQPNNPTGSCLSPGDRAALESLCERRGLALIADEVFGDFPHPGGGEPLPSLLGERRVPTFVLGGLSKSCGLPQMKVAWVVAAGPSAAVEEALRGLEWLADLYLSVSTPAQLALPTWLARRHDFQRRTRERLGANLEAVTRLVAARPEISALRADGGWTQVLRLPATRSDEEWALELLRRDVVTHPGHFYDFAAEACLVVSLLPEPGVFAAGLARLGELVARG